MMLLAYVLLTTGRLSSRSAVHQWLNVLSGAVTGNASHARYQPDVSRHKTRRIDGVRRYHGALRSLRSRNRADGLHRLYRNGRQLMTDRQEVNHGKPPNRPRTNTKSTGSDERNAVIVKDAIR